MHSLLVVREVEQGQQGGVCEGGLRLQKGSPRDVKAFLEPSFGQQAGSLGRSLRCHEHAMSHLIADHNVADLTQQL